MRPRPDQHLPGSPYDDPGPGVGRGPHGRRVLRLLPGVCALHGAGGAAGRPVRRAAGAGLRGGGVVPVHGGHAPVSHPGRGGGVPVPGRGRSEPELPVRQQLHRRQRARAASGQGPGVRPLGHQRRGRDRLSPWFLDRPGVGLACGVLRLRALGRPVDRPVAAPHRTGPRGPGAGPGGNGRPSALLAGVPVPPVVPGTHRLVLLPQLRRVLPAHLAPHLPGEGARVLRDGHGGRGGGGCWFFGGGGVVFPLPPPPPRRWCA